MVIGSVVGDIGGGLGRKPAAFPSAGQPSLSGEPHLGEEFSLLSPILAEQITHGDFSRRDTLMFTLSCAVLVNNVVGMHGA